MADKYISCDAAWRTIIGLEMRDCTGCERYKRGIGDDYCFNEALLAASGAISELPAADVAPVVHAHWKEIAHEGETTLCECTSCGDWIFFHYEYSPNYCPTCGARMDERSEGEA